MQTNISHKLFSVLFFLALVLCVPKIKGQTVNFAPTVQCLGLGTTSMMASPSPIFPSATSYSWSVGASACQPTFVPAVPSGSAIIIDFPCCGYFPVTCTVYNGTTTLAIFSATASILCAPTVSISGSPGICFGATTTLSGSGAQTYTWMPGALTISQLVINPTVATTYTLIGSNANGCTDILTWPVFVNPVPTPSFTYALLPNGGVSFGSTSTNTTNFSSYSWSFGNGLTTTNSISATTSYTNNAIYVVTLSVTNNNGCGPHTYTAAVPITNIGACSIDFITNPGSNGNYNFITSAVTGTTANTTFYWDFGDGTTYSATGGPGVIANHTYTNFGTYTVSLYFSSPSIPCTSTVIAHTLTYTAPSCSLTAGFTYSLSDLNVVDFTSTSVGTSSNTVYSWFFGDTFSVTGTTVATTTHTYNLPGVYTVTLMVLDSLGTIQCTNTASVNVSISLCNLTANFSHTVGANGQVNFSSASSTVSGNIQYHWNFGDGVMSLAANPTHTYYNAGTYTVTLKIKDAVFETCNDSLTVSINVTGIPCSANSNFTLTPTGTPYFWNAIPAYPWDVVAATWSWGDGSVSNSLYSSHQYSIASTYSICLTVTTSCGASSTYCSPYSIYKSEENSSAVYHINVVAPGMSTKLLDNSVESDFFSIYPNPNNGTFYIRYNDQATENISLTVHDLIGKIVYTSKGSASSENTTAIHCEEMVNGIYFVKIDSGNRSFVKKLIIYK